MITLDTSALIAVLEEEPEHALFSRTIYQADRRFMSAVSLQEAGQVVFARRGENGLSLLMALLKAIGVEIIPHDEALSQLAIDAFKTFGKGIHPHARLNFGDCASYALSKKIGAPLLFKGDDFTATDIESALAPPTG